MTTTDQPCSYIETKLYKYSPWWFDEDKLILLYTLPKIGWKTQTYLLKKNEKIERNVPTKKIEAYAVTSRHFWSRKPYLKI